MNKWTAMKKTIFLLLLFIFAGSMAFSQRAPESKPDRELSCEEAALRIQDWSAKTIELKSNVDLLNSEISTLTNSIESSKKGLVDCRDQIKTLLGITDLDIEQFRQKLGVIEGKVRSMKSLSNDELADRRDEVEALENELNELRMSKVSLLPEFYNKIQQIARDIKGLYREKKIKSYTVGTWAEDRDCLWNIANKLEIYGDAFLWPKIWQANKDIVRNPDIIHPGQVLTLPPKGPKDPAELKAERRYWREKREAMEAAAPAEPKGE